MNVRRYEMLFLVGVCVVALVALSCGSTPAGGPSCVDGSGARTQGCNEFSRLNAGVFRNGAEHVNAGWYGLADGDEITTNSSGEAELNLAACWSGHLYCFSDTQANAFVKTCRQSTYDVNPANVTCVPNGTWYTGACAGSYTVITGGVRVDTTGTSFSVTALPQQLDVSLVVVLEGTVTATPVVAPGDMKLGDVAKVEGGQFYFTMPGDQPALIGGLQPRKVYDLKELPPVVNELGIRTWMVAVHDKATQDKVLPPNWPAELTGEPGDAASIQARMGGGALADPGVQESVTWGVDWQRVLEGLPPGSEINVLLNDRTVWANDLVYDPARAKEFLAAAGDQGLNELVVFFPADDGDLATAARLIADSLISMGLEVSTQEVGLADLQAKAESEMQAGLPVMVLSR